MPPVVLLALIGAAGIAGYRILSSHAASSPKAPERRSSGPTRHSAPPIRDLGSLEWDESTGVYRPERRRKN
jgi:hypothetical protein